MSQGIGVQGMAGIPGMPGARMRPGMMRIDMTQQPGMMQQGGVEELSSRQMQMQQAQQQALQQQMLQQQLGAVLSSGGNPFGTPRGEEGDNAQAGSDQAAQGDGSSSASSESSEQQSTQTWSLPFMSMFQSQQSSAGTGTEQQEQEGNGNSQMPAPSSVAAPPAAYSSMPEPQANFGLPQAQTYGGPAPSQAPAYNPVQAQAGYGGSAEQAPTGLGRYANQYSASGYGMMPMPKATGSDRPFAHRTVVSR
jgi:hypothetical protein